MIARHVYSIVAMLALLALAIATVGLWSAGKFITVVFCLMAMIMLMMGLVKDWRKCKQSRENKVLLG